MIETELKELIATLKILFRYRIATARSVLLLLLLSEEEGRFNAILADMAATKVGQKRSHSKSTYIV
jgi:hypothetical protein